MSNLEFDNLTLGLKKVTVSIWKLVRTSLFSLGAIIFLVAFVYGIFSLVWSTDTERRLAREIRMYRRAYPELEQKRDMLCGAITGLQYKDSEIYTQVFHSNAPNADPMSSFDFLFGSDTIPDTRLYSYTRDKADALEGKRAAIDSIFEGIFARLASGDCTVPPMSLPLKDVSSAQVGASAGNRMSPFLGAYVPHDGLDFIVPRGTPVYAPADGVVTQNTGISKSEGRYLSISHAGGYTTRYAHLESVLVGRGQSVKRGQKIGTVGMSGKTTASHLHYSVYRDTVAVDPVNYFFASTGVEEYANMYYMAAGTMQSMD